LLRELLDAKRGRRSERLSEDQVALVAAAWQARQAEKPEEPKGSDDDDAAPGAPGASPAKRGGGRQRLPRHLKRERIIHDLTEAEKHCNECQQDLRLIGEPLRPLFSRSSAFPPRPAPSETYAVIGVLLLAIALAASYLPRSLGRTIPANVDRQDRRILRRTLACVRGLKTSAGCSVPAGRIRLVEQDMQKTLAPSASVGKGISTRAAVRCL
jgi:hypothetical protein